MTALTQPTGKQWDHIQISKLNSAFLPGMFFSFSIWLQKTGEEIDGGSRKCTLYCVSGAGEAGSYGFREKKYFPHCIIRAYYPL